MSGAVSSPVTGKAPMLIAAKALPVDKVLMVATYTFVR